MPIIVSTGMAVYGEIEDALGAVAEAGNEEVALLRCASVYPVAAGDHEPALDGHDARGLRRARRALGPHARASRCPTGAAALGMDLLEKHFTLSRTMEGPDHPFAIEPDELRALVAAVREVEAALGTGRLRGPVRGRARRDVHASPGGR